MQVQAIRLNTPEPTLEQLEQMMGHHEPRPQPTFGGYNSELKTLWRAGKLPQVKKGFYGGKLTQDTLSLEHLEAHSKGGKTELNNLVITTKANNCKRGNKPLAEFLNLKAMAEYLLQFVNIKVGNFDGNAYIKGIIQKVGELL